MNKDEWATRFKKGLDHFEADLDLDPDYTNHRLRKIVDMPDDSDNVSNNLYSVGWNTLAHNYINKASEHLEMLFSEVESPIEEAMLCALCTSAHEHVDNVRYKRRNFIFGDFNDQTDLLLIEPQAKLGEYRADFLLTYTCMVPDPESERKLKDGTSIYGVKDATFQLIVECDGHDFHDRTKEQASKDRKRDRDLKKLGFEVFRYTGSDIWKNPISCASESIKALMEKAPNKL